MKQPYISIVVPAYNEAHLIADTLVSLDHYLSNLGKTYEILVVDDGSKDDTAKIVDKLRSMISNVLLIGHGRNMGKGAAVRTGILAARGKYRLFLDADHSTSIDHLGQALLLLKDHDIIIGSRGVDGSVLDVPQSWIKRSFGNLGNLFVRGLLLRGVKDTQCGFKLFKEDVVETLFTKQRIDGWSFDIELLAMSKKLGYSVKEMPVRWVDGPKSRVGPWSYMQVFIDILKIRWWLWRNSHNLPQ